LVDDDGAPEWSTAAALLADCPVESWPQGGGGGVNVAPGCARLVPTHAACVQSSSCRVISQDVAEDESAELWINDVPGAYYSGTPIAPGQPSGQALCGRIPPGFDEFGDPPRNTFGGEMLFFVQGNLPGRRDAGQIWGNAYALFLRGQGFLQTK